MITKFKLYEAVNQGEPEIGDYAIFSPDIPPYNAEFGEYINNYIGKIIKMDDWLLDVEYENMPEKFNVHKNNIRQIPTDYIKYWSSNKEDIEEILATNKYNL